MDVNTVMLIAREGLYVTALVASPILLAALALGLLIGILQAATQIQEMTLTFVPKIIAVFLALLFSFPWIMDKMITFTREVFLNFPQYIR